MALLGEYDTHFGLIKITQTGDGRISYVQNGCYHSQAEKNGESVCVYIHLLETLIRTANARKILIIGGAGGTLATMLRRQGRAVTVVDINPTAFLIARRFFALPTGIRCVVRDGVLFVRSCAETFDAVVIDVFGSKNRVPAAFTTFPFFRAIRRLCGPTGLMLMNVITRSNRDATADVIARHALAAGLPVRVYDWPGHIDRNTLLVSGGSTKTYPRADRLPSKLSAEMRDDLDGMIIRRPRRIGS